MLSSSSDNENTAIWDCDDFVPGMFLPTYEEDNKEEEEEEDGEDRERDNTIYSLNGDYNWIVTLRRRGLDGDGEVSATTWTRSTSKKALSSSSLSSFLLQKR